MESVVRSHGETLRAENRVGEVEEVDLRERAVSEVDRFEVVNEGLRFLRYRGEPVGTFASCNRKWTMVTIKTESGQW